MDLFTTDESLFLAQVKLEPGPIDNGDQRWQIQHNSEQLYKPEEISNPEQVLNPEQQCNPDQLVITEPYIKLELINPVNVKSEEKLLNVEYLHAVDEQLTSSQHVKDESDVPCVSVPPVNSGDHVSVDQQCATEVLDNHLDTLAVTRKRNESCHGLDKSCYVLLERLPTAVSSTSPSASSAPHLLNTFVQVTNVSSNILRERSPTTVSSTSPSASSAPHLLNYRTPQGRKETPLTRRPRSRPVTAAQTDVSSLRSTQLSTSNPSRNGQLSTDKAPTSSASMDTLLNCTACSQRCNTVASLKQHMLSHIDPKYRHFAWSICYKLHNLKEEEEGLVTEDSANTRQAVNEVCSEQSTAKTTNNGNVVKEPIVKPFQCNVCSKCLRSKSCYERHLLIHNDVRPFQCNVCSKRFKRKTNLAQHARIHSDVKPFQCAICGKRFRFRGSLQRHVLTHADERNKPFKCHICNKGFIRKRSLMAHVQTHTNIIVKPFKLNVPT